jgi:hypothetical protein
MKVRQKGHSGKVKFGFLEGLTCFERMPIRRGEKGKCAGSGSGGSGVDSFPSG